MAGTQDKKANTGSTDQVSQNAKPQPGADEEDAKTFFGTIKYIIYGMIIDGDCQTLSSIHSAYDEGAFQVKAFVAFYTIAALWMAIVGINTPSASITFFIVLTLLNAKSYEFVFGEDSKMLTRVTSNILLFSTVFLCIGALVVFLIYWMTKTTYFLMAIYVVYKIYTTPGIYNKLSGLCPNKILLGVIIICLALLITFIINRYIASAVGMLLFSFSGSVPSIIGTLSLISIFTGGKSGVPLERMQEFMYKNAYIYVPAVMIASLFCQWMISKALVALAKKRREQEREAKESASDNTVEKEETNVEEEPPVNIEV